MTVARIKFIGTSAATPSGTRGFSCLALHYPGNLRKTTTEGNQLEERVILFDCGDGAVHGLVKNGVDVNKILSIFVSHMHSDHVSGLTSVIETMGIFGRTSDLTVFGPPEMKEYFEVVGRVTKVAKNRKFMIYVREAKPHLSLNEVEVKTFEMEHSVPSMGFRVKVGDKEFSYSGDTQPCRNSTNLAKDVPLLIHEATFLQKDKEKAIATMHTTAKEAAETAAKSNVKNLILTHVNNIYDRPDALIAAEAKNYFPKVKVAKDGMTVNLS